MRGPCSTHWRVNGVWREIQKERENWKDIDVWGGGTILKWMLEKYEEYSLDSSGSGEAPVAGSCDHHNEPLRIIKFWEFLE
jgi:hypothetical protein